MWTDGQYLADDNLATKQGYWLYCHEGCTFELDGVLDPTKTIDLSTGWMLRGTTARGVFSDPTKIHQTLWTWDAENQQFQALESDTEIETNKGYWIYGKESGTLEIIAE